jgi:hypothetical protein
VTDGWGQSGPGGWGEPGDGTRPSGAGPGGWGPGDTSGGWAAGDGSGSWGAADTSSEWGGWRPDSASAFTLPSPVSVLPLFGGILCGLLGIVLSRFGSATNVIPPIVGWLLCTFGDVLAVAWYQQRDLAAAFDSMNYRPAGGAAALRTVALVLAAIGIVANSVAIAHWAATR